MENEYIVITIDKVQIPITRTQRDKIMQAREVGQNMVMVKDCWINTNTDRIYPADMVPMTEGYLHDGTKVILQFGEWKDARDPSLRLDPQYYPELLTDGVKRTKEEAREAYEQIGHEEIKQIGTGQKASTGLSRIENK